MRKQVPKNAVADPLESMLGFQLRRASVAVMAALTKELEPLGVLPSEASLLMFIGANPGCTQSAVGRALRAKPANLVPLVNKLMLMDALERAPGKGRAISLSLSASGRTLYEKARKAFARHDERIARSLSAKARRDVIRALMQVCEDACCAD